MPFHARHVNRNRQNGEINQSERAAKSPSRQALDEGNKRDFLVMGLVADAAGT